MEAAAASSASSASSTGAGGGREPCQPGDPPETLVANVDGAHGLAQDDENLYLTIAAKDPGSIVVARKHDGDTSTVDTGLKAPRHIAHARGYVFYTTHNGHLLRVGKDYLTAGRHTRSDAVQRATRAIDNDFDLDFAIHGCAIRHNVNPREVAVYLYPQSCVYEVSARSRARYLRRAR